MREEVLTAQKEVLTVQMWNLALTSEKQLKCSRIVMREEVRGFQHLRPSPITTDTNVDPSTSAHR
jgi:hypothetical protein